MRLVVCLLSVAALSAACSRAPRSEGLLQDPVTTVGQLNALLDVEQFAREPHGTAAMESSYDRTGANSDWMVPKPIAPDGEMELCVLDGPGCVTRIWMTSLGSKQWRFYFDGEKSPRIDVANGDLFGKGVGPFLSPLSGYVSGGSYSYVPIPFQKSLRICAVVSPFTAASRKYFHVNYCRYPEGTPVESFPGTDDSAVVAAAGEVAARWGDCSAWLKESANVQMKRVAIAPGGKADCLTATGPAVMRALRVAIVTPQGSLPPPRVMRELVLRIFWDGSDAPSVEAPLGDFFGNAMHARRYASLALGCGDDGYICRFPMPFRKGMKLQIENTGSTAAELDVGADLQSGEVTGLDRYFHASWRSAVGRGVPYRVFETEGRGHYVGCYLVAWSLDGSWKILEGDESIFVDGESRPSWQGTGLEDYFSGAWYYTGLFDLPTHGLLEKAAMRTAQYRQHLSDPVKFDRRLAMTFEFGEANRSRGYMSSTAYWYQDAPVAAQSELQTGDQRWPAKNQLDPAVIMTELFELERAGLSLEPEQRCRTYAGRYPGPLADILNLRADIYRGRRLGWDVVLPSLKQWAGKSGKQIAAQAAQWLRYIETPDSGLLAAHSNGGYELFLDGKPVSRATGKPSLLAVRNVPLPAGKHEITAFLTPARADAWFSACLIKKDGDIRTDETWEVTTQRPPKWPSTEGSTGWKPVGRYTIACMLPRMGAWLFEPNAFPQTQSEIQLLRCWSGWGKKPGETAYVRKVFTVPASDDLP